MAYKNVWNSILAASARHCGFQPAVSAFQPEPADVFAGCLDCCNVATVSQITLSPDGAGSSDGQAAAQLLPIVYDELRRVAAAKLAREKDAQTLQPTALVHEAWLRLGGDNQRKWHDRCHFFRAAAEAMRRILVDRARAKATGKRAAIIEPLDETTVELNTPREEVLAVHEVLDLLAHEDPAAAEVVKLRYFVGLTVPEIAEVMNTSTSTVDRNWSYARVWLKRALLENQTAYPKKSTDG